MMSKSRIVAVAAMLIMLAAGRAEASMFEGETLDQVANAMSWLVIVLVPVVVIYLFWMVHVMPEKIAHNRHHPQKDAIQALCVLSLFFGGLLWPLAWLWAYSKPVMYKLAYGTDKVVHGEPESQELDETASLRQEIAQLKAALASTQDQKEV